MADSSEIEIVKDAHGHYRKGNVIFGECEVCDSKDVEITLHYGNMWFCNPCWIIESNATAELKKNGEAIQVVESLSPIPSPVQLGRVIDNSIQTRSDLFNSSTVAILELKNSIDADSSIQNKPYKLATELIDRFNHFKSVVFEANETIVKATNDQRAIQVYLNQMSNTLRQEEREKLRIQDINYKPSVIKPVTPKSIKTTGTKKVKLDKVELRKYATELGISEIAIQMIVISKNIDVKTAADIIRKSIESAKSQLTNSTNEVK